jgi:hypothetical protein
MKSITGETGKYWICVVMPSMGKEEVECCTDSKQIHDHGGTELPDPEPWCHPLRARKTATLLGVRKC